MSLPSTATQRSAAAADWVDYLDRLENLALRLESLVVEGGDLTSAAQLVAGAPTIPPGLPPAHLHARRVQVQRLAERALSVLERQRDVLRDDIAAVPLHAQGRTVGTRNETLGGSVDLQG